MDIGRLDYHARTPWEAPLGGSESALVYLAQTLARRGHEITLLNRNSRPGTYAGVNCLSVMEIKPSHFLENPYDAVIHLNYAEALPALRKQLPPQTRLLHWHHHNHSSDTSQALALPEVQAACDVIVFVSLWQTGEMAKKFKLKRQKCTFRQNAIGFPFRDLFKDAQEIGKAKKGTPKLAYTSIPGRGLAILLAIFPRLRHKFPSLELHIFSSLQVYQASTAEEASMEKLYQACQTMAGVVYHGSLPQPQLAEELMKIHFLAYPNTFLETSSIAVMEAMASACYIVTSNYGALPETTREFADLVDVTPSETFAARFEATLIQAIEKWIQGPQETLQHLSQQALDINLRNTWHTKGWEWDSLLYQVCKKTPQV